MFRIRCGGKLLGAGATLGAAIDQAMRSNGQGSPTPGEFVRVAVETPRVVPDDDDDDEPADTALAMVVTVDGDDVRAVWVYTPQDNVRPPAGLRGSRGTFLTDEAVDFDASACVAAQRPALADHVVHKAGSRFEATLLSVDHYAAVVAADGEAAFDMHGASAAARHSLDNLLLHADKFNALEVAEALKQLRRRLGRCPFSK